ncbi:hypothetical protein BaRGS_00015390, partial [Batillaria attramentaria]
MTAIRCCENMYIVLNLVFVCVSSEPYVWNESVFTEDYLTGYGPNLCVDGQAQFTDGRLCIPNTFPCDCSPTCEFHGTCCSRRVPGKIAMAYTLTGCLQDRTYAMVRCPVWGSEKDIREACETGQGKYTLDEPVTDPNTNVTYRNAFCAQCHGVESYTTWDQLNVTCAHFQHVLSAVSREQLLDMAKQEVNQCTVTRARPDEVVPLYCPEPTWFSDPVVNSCNVTGGWATEDYNAAFVFNCRVYNGPLLRVRKGGVTYLNLFCALCNGITLNAMQCTQLIGGSISGSEPPLSLLLGLRGSPAGDELQDVGDCSSSHWLDHA